MASLELFSSLIGINLKKLSSTEIRILEISLFIKVCKALEEIFHEELKDTLLTRQIVEKGSHMYEARFLTKIVNDILNTDLYTIAGIAYETNVPEDVICDIILEQNRNPSLEVSRKIIELHRKVDPALYQRVINKISAEYLINKPDLV